MTVPAHHPGADLDLLLTSRLRPGLAGTVLATRTATVVFEAPGECWTVELAGGRARVRRGRGDRADLVVRGSAGALADIAASRVSGAGAFLAGRVAVRGDLALSLQLDGLFGGEQERPDGLLRAGQVPALGVASRYVEAGPPDAPPVVLLHGLGATNASMLPVLVDLAVDHRVLAPDLPGFGASAAPRCSYSSAWFAAWLEDFQARTSSRGAVLIGNSLGGRVALEAGLTHPRSLRALVLLAPSPAFRSMRQVAPLVRALSPRLAQLPLPRLSHPFVIEAIKGMMSDPSRLPQAWYDAAADEAVRVLRSPAHRVAFLSCSRQIYLEEAHGRAGFWDRLGGLQPPALFVWGDRDRLVPASFSRHVGAVLPEGGSVVLEDCGHVPQFEHPRDTMALVRGFLSSL